MRSVVITFDSPLSSGTVSICAVTGGWRTQELLFYAESGGREDKRRRDAREKLG